MLNFKRNREERLEERLYQSHLSIASNKESKLATA